MLGFRETLIVAAIAAAISNPGSYAQAQRGRGERSGPGGPVGPVGRSGLILSLAQYPVVQQELKLTEPQKTKIRSVAELSNQRQGQLRDQMNPRGQSGPGGNGGGGPGGQGNARAEMAERFAAMGEARMVLDQDIERALASILDRGQYGRLKQIQLQVEGISALTRPDIIEKLNLDEFQVEQIRELLDQSLQAQRESGQAMFEMMRPALPNPAKNGLNPGGGGPGGPDLRDPAVQEAMKAFMAKPEVRAKMSEMHAQSTKFQGQLLAVVVSRVFGKRQAATYKKMLGAPLDLSQPRGGRGQGPGHRPPGENQSDRANAAGKAEASDSDDDEAATSKAASKSKGTDANATAKRKSLRQQRGLDD
jgi:hypothetical protein